MGPKGPLIRHEVLSELQQLCMLLGVHPPQVLHMLNHHLHCFTHSGLLHMQENLDVNKQASLLTLALEGHFSTLKGLSKHKPDEWPQASLNGWTLWSWIE